MNIQEVIALVKRTKELVENQELAEHIKVKGPADYVTQVDTRVQNFLQEELSRLAPQIQFLGEEAGLQEITGDSFWILDPIDGTTNLIHGYLHSTVSLGLYRQGEIVIVAKSSFDSGRPIVKRVIATGGQTVDVDYDTSTVYVDGQPLDEPYIKEEMYHPPYQQTHWEVPEGSIFVMGDNRNNSTDSRDDRLGPIDTGYVLGKAVLALWPVSRFGPV